MGFTKLDDNLDGSSIFREPDAVFKVWMLILSKTRSDGLAPISADYIVSITRKSDEEVDRCLEILKGPDPHSRSQNDEGRRIRRVDGGFHVINYEKYRQRADADGVREYERERKRRWREEEKGSPSLPEPEAEGPVLSRTVPDISDMALLPFTEPVQQKTKPELACGLFVQLWNHLFSTNYRREGTGYEGLVRDFEKRCKGGTIKGHSWPPCQSGEILMATVIGCQTGRQFWREQRPDVMLRTGANPRTGSNGETTGGTDHVRSLLMLPQGKRIVLSSDLARVAEGYGILGELLKLGMVTTGGDEC